MVTVKLRYYRGPHDGAEQVIRTDNPSQQVWMVKSPVPHFGWVHRYVPARGHQINGPVITWIVDVVHDGLVKESQTH